MNSEVKFPKDKSHNIDDDKRDKSHKDDYDDIGPDAENPRKHL